MPQSHSTQGNAIRGLPTLFTYQQVAGYLALSVVTVKRLVSAGEIGCIPVGRRKVRFTVRHIQDYLTAQERPCKKASDGSTSATAPVAASKSAGPTTSESLTSFQQALLIAAKPARRPPRAS